MLCIVGLKQDLIRYKNIPLCWSGACTRALETQKEIRPTWSKQKLVLKLTFQNFVLGAALTDTVFTCGAPTGSDILHQGSCSFTNGSTCGYRFRGHWKVHNGTFRYFFSDRIKDGHNSGICLWFITYCNINAHVLSFQTRKVMTRFHISYNR